MNKQNTNWGLIIAIIFASAAISGSLVFFGMQMGGKSGSIDWDKFVVKVGDGIDAYVKRQQAEQFDQQQSQQAVKNDKAKDVKKLDPSRDHVRGNLNAEVTLYEYSDYVCPYCAKFHPIALKAFQDYNGKINWVFRHWPLPGHDPVATLAAEGSECVNEMGGNDKFWAYTDAIFQARLNGTNFNNVDDLATVAGGIGIDKDKFKSCVESGKYTARVKEDLAEGEKIGIEGTPGNILVNNKTGQTVSVDGAQPIEVVKLAVEKALGNK